MKKLLLFTLALLSLLSCDDREIELISNFGFTADFQYDKTINALVDNPIRLTIIPEEIVDNTIYNVSYEIIEGSGTIKFGDEIYNQKLNYLLELEEMKTSLVYNSSSTKDSKIKFILTDNYGGRFERILEFNINDVKFEIDSSVISNNIFIGQSTEINLFLNQENAAPVTYRVKYLIKDSDAKLLDNEGNIIEQNTFFNIEKGKTAFTYTPNKVGNNDIEFVFMSQFGDDSVENLSITTKENNYKITSVYSKDEFYELDSTVLDVNINQFYEAGIDYEIMIHTNADVVDIVNANGNTINVNEFVKADLGNNRFNITSKVYKNLDVEILVKDQYGKIQELSNKLNIKKTTFDIIIDSLDDRKRATDPHIIRFKVVPFGTKTLDYKLSFKSNLQATGMPVYFATNRINIFQGGPVDISSIIRDVEVWDNTWWYGQYTPRDKGTHNIDFFFESSNGEKVTKRYTVEIEPIIDPATSPSPRPTRPPRRR